MLPRSPGAVRPRRPRRSAAEAAMAVRVVPQRAQEVHVAEVRPQGLAEVVLRVGGLPHQEAGEPLLPRGADQQVRIRLPARVEVLGDVIDAQALDELGHVLAALERPREDLPHGVDDLLASLRDSVEAAVAAGPVTVDPEVAAFIEALDPAALSDADFDGLLVAAGLVGEQSGDGLDLPERMAEVNAMLDVASPAMREALLVAFLDRLQRPVRGADR